MKKKFIFIFVFVYSYVCGMQHDNLYYKSNINNGKTAVLKKYYKNNRVNSHKKCNCCFISDYVYSDIEYCSKCLQKNNLYSESQENQDTNNMCEKDEHAPDEIITNDIYKLIVDEFDVL